MPRSTFCCCLHTSCGLDSEAERCMMDGSSQLNWKALLSSANVSQSNWRRKKGSGVYWKTLRLVGKERGFIELPTRSVGIYLQSIVPPISHNCIGTETPSLKVWPPIGLKFLTPTGQQLWAHKLKHECLKKGWLSIWASSDKNLPSDNFYQDHFFLIFGFYISWNIQSKKAFEKIFIQSEVMGFRSLLSHPSEIVPGNFRRRFLQTGLTVTWLVLAWAGSFIDQPDSCSMRVHLQSPRAWLILTLMRLECLSVFCEIACYVSVLKVYGPSLTSRVNTVPTFKRIMALKLWMR